MQLFITYPSLLKIAKVIVTHFLLCVHLYIIAHLLSQNCYVWIRPLLLSFEHEEDKVTVLSRSNQLHKDAYKNVFIGLREKHN